MFLWLEKAVEVAGQPQIVFLSKTPHRTLWMVVAYQNKDQNWLQTFLKDVGQKGWTENKSFPKPPAYSGQTVFTIELQKPGSGVFKGWTDAERRSFMKDIKATLAGYGIGVHHVKLTMADCM